jgi:aspartyl-tRNA(Asn)/glutamyl-tRNA(Gln) amidotransferase subunit B
VRVSSSQKAFSQAPNLFDPDANIFLDPLSVGLPGSLPLVNPEVIKAALLLGEVVGGVAAQTLTFDRKCYFYPDLPKGYQITQKRNPIISGGKLPFERNGDLHNCTIRQIHIEEDAAKIIHLDNQAQLDFNRAGVPLLEVVTEPCFNNGKDAASFVRSLRRLVRDLEISDGDMEKGSIRCDANVSVHNLGTTNLNPYKVEIKNLNSFKFISEAIDFEVQRQIEVFESGEQCFNETRGYDEVSKTTHFQRSKEVDNVYWFIPEPDIPEIILDKRIKKDNSQLLPYWDWETHFAQMTGLTLKELRNVSSPLELRTFFEAMISNGIDPKIGLNWILGPILQAKKNGISIDRLQNGSIQLLIQVQDDKVSWATAKGILFEFLILNPHADIRKKIDDEGLGMEKDINKLDLALRKLVDLYPMEYHRLVGGDEKVVGFFMGKLRKELPEYDPKKISERLKNIQNASR